MEEIELQFEPPFVVDGDGSSLWSDTTDSSFEISRISLGNRSLNAYGKNLPWQVYTDRGIEKAIFTRIAPEIQKKFCIELKSLEWSEQGLQDNGRWNFDVEVRKL